MKHLKKWLSIVLLLAFTVFPTHTQVAHAEEGKLKVVSSFSIITDMVEQIGGDKVTVHNLVPIGTDPHEYSALPEDNKAMEEADVLFFNGLNLEGGEHGWFNRLIESTKTKAPAFEVSKEVTPKFLKDEAGKQETNPHNFISPKSGVIMSKAILAALVEVDAKNKDYYEKRADEYIKKIEDLDKAYQEKIGDLPEENRVFIASELAFQYMTDDYGLKEGCIWAIDTDDNGSPQQIQQAIEFVKENKPKVLFVESNVDPRPMEKVSLETGVPIYKDKIMSDEIGKKGEPGDTYVSYLERNLDIISNGLTKGND